MQIGVPRESKDREDRVGVIPDGVRTLVAQGHEVAVETGAGLGSGFEDAAYTAAGARIVDRATAFGEPDLVVKVKEPNPGEIALLRPGQVIFTYLHLAAARDVATALLESGVTGIAYETIQNPDGSFPVLAPMSEVAGRLAAQIGITLLQRDNGGKGVLIGGVPGVQRGRVCVLGAGTVGINAVRIAYGLGADVDVLDIDLRRLGYVYDLFGGRLNTLFADPNQIERSVVSCDLLIGAIYVRGRRAPTLVPERMVAQMEAGSVIVDVAVDQGGCVETIHPTTHSDPVYRVHEVLHYGVANMPGAVPRTSTLALTNTTLPYVERIAGKGVEAAVKADPALALGVNVWQGTLVDEGVGDALSLPVTPLETLLSAG